MVTAVSVPPSHYASMSSEGLYNAAEEIRAKRPAFLRAVDQSRKQDKVNKYIFYTNTQKSD